MKSALIIYNQNFTARCGKVILYNDNVTEKQRINEKSDKHILLVRFSPFV